MLKHFYSVILTGHLSLAFLVQNSFHFNLPTLLFEIENKAETLPPVVILC